MELRIPCSTSSMHIIVDDVNVVWVSGRDLAVLLKVTQARAILDQYDNLDSYTPLPKDRAEFPKSVLDSSFDSTKKHEFVQLASVHCVLKAKHHSIIAVILQRVMSELAAKAISASVRVGALFSASIVP